MTPRAWLSSLHHRWQRATLQRQLTGVYAYLADSNSCWMERPNRYVEHDIGFKLVRYPDGSKRRLRVTKVRDTAGFTFYTFPHDTPLS